jgi:hypothetical protein
MKPFHGRYALVASVLITTAALAAPASGAARDRKAEVGALEYQVDRLTEEARQLKGGPQQRLLLRRERLRGVIDRLRAGEDVDPREIEPLLAE